MSNGRRAIGRTERQKQRTRGHWQMGERQYPPCLLDLIQFFLCRADLVKLVVFSDKARAFCGRFLKDQLCIEEEIGVFGLQIACCHPAVLWLNLNADAVPACSESSDQCCASPAKWVKHGASWFNFLFFTSKPQAHPSARTHFAGKGYRLASN